MEQLALKAASQPSASGSPLLLLVKSHPAYLAKISLSPPPTLATNTQGIATSPLELLFVKPRVLMNISGPSILSASKTFLPLPANSYRLITIQDDLDLPSNTIKLQKGGSPRGHNGVRSLAAALGTRDFYRLRIGIGRPENKGDVAKFVMGAMGRDEVRACESNEDGKGGAVLEACWKEIVRIGWEDVE